MSRPRRSPLALWLLAAAVTGACATAAPPPPPTAAPPPPPAPPRVVAIPPPAPLPPPPPPPEILPEAFESDDFIVTRARQGDTAATLAQRFLGEASKAWLIEDYTGSTRFEAGQTVVIPRREWNPAGVDESGYQIVPVLVYHNLGPQAKGRMLMAASRFEEQMRYLKREGYRVVSLREFLEFTAGKRQLPRRAVVLSFDDGYRSFREIAYPILKELGFTATLFVYTDYIGAGRNALGWKDLRELQDEGFDVQGHSKTHADLRRGASETEAQYAARLQSELERPQALFRQHLGRSGEALAYPYGAWDEGLLKEVGRFGYTAAFTVRRQSNSAFVTLTKVNRSQVYAEMSLEDFARNLNVFNEENLK